MENLLCQLKRLEAKREELMNVSAKVIVKSTIVGILFGLILATSFILSLEMGLWSTLCQ